VTVENVGETTSPAMAPWPFKKL